MHPFYTLMNIMNRARKLAVMDDEERSQTSFRMDRNGNLRARFIMFISVS
jgi:prespore-specific regulator